MTDTDFQEMRQQMELLKEKLNRQEIVNEQLIRKGMESRLDRLNMSRRMKRISMLLCLLFLPEMLVYTLGMPVWFGIATMALFALALLYHEVFMEHISANDLNRLSFKQISEKAIRLKEQGRRWLWFSIPTLIAWLGVFYYLISQHADGDPNVRYVLYGMVTGLIIGACLGTIIYRKRQRMIDDLRSDLPEQ